MTRVHMAVAEVKRRFADVIGRVVHAGDRIVVERRGRPVVAIVPLSDLPADLRLRPDMSPAEQRETQPHRSAARVPEKPPTAPFGAPPDGAERSDGGSILDVLGCGGPEADEFCKIIDELIEERGRDTGRPAPSLE